MFRPLPPNKFNCMNMGYLTPSLTLNSIKYFLDQYKVSDNKEIFSEKFRQTCPLYSEESQKPDSFILSQKSIDRNQAFYTSYGQHGKKRSNNNYYNSYQNKTKRCNFYPKVPLMLNPSCELKNGIPLEKKEEEKNNAGDKEDFKDYDNFMGDLKSKIWFIKCLKENEKDVKQYGPFNSEKIYGFLKGSYMTLPPEEQRKSGLLIIDVLSDVHYQPETLFTELKNEFLKKH